MGLLLMRRCIGHGTKQRVGHMQNDSRHKLPGFDYAQKAHIVTVEGIECVGEIKFHQHIDLESMPRGIDVLNGWLLRNLLAYRLQADLDRSIASVG